MRICTIVTVLLLFILSACKTVDPTPPVPTTLVSDLKIPQSELVFPVEFSVKELSDILNVVVSGTFFKAPLNMNERGDILNLEITKSAPLKLHWQMPILKMEIPLHLSGTGEIKIGKKSISNKEAVESDILLVMNSKLDITPDWKLKTKSEIVEIKWINEPVVKIAFFKLNLRSKVEEAIKSREEELLKNIDKAIAEKVELKKAVTKIWLDIQKPVRINKKEVLVWLQNKAESVSARMLDRGSEVICLQVDFCTSTKILFDDDTLTGINKVLPPYTKLAKGTKEHLELYMGATIPYGLINKKLNEKKDELKLAYGEYSAKIKHIEVYGTDSAVAVKVNVRGDIKGDIYLTGKIIYDSLKNTIGLGDIKYDMNTQNTLLQTADWIFHDNLPKLISDKLTIGLDSITEKIPLLLDRGIEKSKVGKKLDADIDLRNITLQQILITKNNIQIVALARAKARIHVEKAAFSKKVKPLRITKVKGS